MNRLSLKYTLLFVLSFTIFLSCKKKNDLNPYPGNSRLLNITQTVTTTSGTGSTNQPVTNNYRFNYDDHNRVIKIIYTTNDPAQANLTSTLIYSHDTIYDYIRHVNYSLVELDTFVTDQKGNIATTFMLGVRKDFQYLGKLLTRIDYPDGTYEVLNSYNGNFIKSVSSLGSAHDDNFTYYTDQVNRIGDYLQLKSVSRYGLNFYQNNALVRTLDFPFDKESINVAYDIDANSKITKMTATHTLAPYVIGPLTIPNITTEVNELQYEQAN